jgi:hypothetical protein
VKREQSKKVLEAANPLPENIIMEEKVGRFGHHPSPAIDFCVEVGALEAMEYERAHGFDPHNDFEHRLSRALDFNVGGDEIAVRAKDILRGIASRARPDAKEPARKMVGLFAQLTPEQQGLALSYVGPENIGDKDTLKIKSEIIDALTSALQGYMSYSCPACGGDCSSANPPQIGCPTRAGYDALALVKKNKET